MRFVRTFTSASTSLGGGRPPVNTTAAKLEGDLDSCSWIRPNKMSTRDADVITTEPLVGSVCRGRKFSNSDNCNVPTIYWATSVERAIPSSSTSYNIVAFRAFKTSWTWQTQMHDQLASEWSSCSSPVVYTECPILFTKHHHESSQKQNCQKNTNIWRKKKESRVNNPPEQIARLNPQALHLHMVYSIQRKACESSHLCEYNSVYDGWWLQPHQHSLAWRQDRWASHCSPLLSPTHNHPNFSSCLTWLMQCLQRWINHHHLNEWINWSSLSCVSISSGKNEESSCRLFRVCEIGVKHWLKKKSMLGYLHLWQVKRMHPVFVQSWHWAWQCHHPLPSSSFLLSPQSRGLPCKFRMLCWLVGLFICL